MKITITPSRLRGNITAPASKSSMQRALAAALLAKGVTTLHNPGESNDDKAALNIVRKLGATVTTEENGDFTITSDGLKPLDSSIECGESGLSIRMFTPIAALSDKSITITGSGSLSTRPMDFFDDILPKLGVSIKSAQGKLPLIIQGPLKPANIEVDGSLSSQFLTGLLMAYAAAGANNVSIKVKNLKSKPYIDLTLNVMQQFGLPVPTNNNYEEFVFTNEQTPAAVREYTVEGDWSSGALLLVAGAISGPIIVRGLDLNSTQADSAIVDALMDANAGIAIEAKGIRIHQSAMKGFDFDATDCPDLFPPLVALAAYCKGKTTIKGVSRLEHKESNRALALQDEFDKMGVFIEIENDTMIIHGTAKVKGADVHSQNDHRIAMACAVAALRADSETVIEEAQAVDKSYPGFFDDLRAMGATISPEKKFVIS